MEQSLAILPLRPLNIKIIDCFQITRRIMAKRQRSFTTDEVVDMLDDSELSSDEEVEEPNMPGSDSEWSYDEQDMGRRETNDIFNARMHNISRH